MRPHGVRGEIKCMPMSHDPDRYRSLKSVELLCADGSALSAVIEKSARHGNLWHFKFAGFDSPEACQSLVNAEVRIPISERAPLPPGQYYFSDLEGLDAIDDKGSKVGKVVYVAELPSVNALVLRIAGQEVFAPWIDDCIGDIHLENRTVTVHMDYLQDMLGGASTDTGDADAH